MQFATTHGMSAAASTTCLECGGLVDAAMLGGACPHCLLGDALALDAELADGGFDGHEILGEIARGGMGVVYRARQLEPSRVVALKTLRGASLDSAEARARFRHEAEVMVALDHPAILPVHHFGEMDGIPFFTMKLADGGTLAEHLKRYEGKWSEIATLMATLCDAVRHAHERGVLHRDLKPGNVLFDAAGQVYVSDFGIAKLSDAKDALTLTQSVLGTPYYLAPEVAQSGPKAASVSSDVWSLGVMLFELLTGQRPFEGESVTMVLRALDTGSAPLATALRADVPRDLAVICGKALQREPARRYASAQEFADDLRAWLEDRPIRARAVPAHERVGLWARRNPMLASLVMLLAVAMVAAIASLAFGFRTAKRETERVSAAQAETRSQLRAALLHQARSGRISREMGWRQSGIEALQQANTIRPGEDVRDELVAHLAGHDLVQGARIFEDVVIPSPSLRFCLRTKNDTTALAIARLDDLVNLFDVPDQYDGRLTMAHFPADESWVAVSLKAGTRVFSMREDHVQLAHWPGFQVVGESRDNLKLYLAQESRWRVIETKGWSELAAGDSGGSTTIGGKRTPRVPVFHAQPNMTLGAVAQESEMSVIDWSTGAEARRLKPVLQPQYHTWSETGLVIGCGEIGHGFDFMRDKEVFYGPGFGSPQHLMIAHGTELLTSSMQRRTGLWHLHTGQRLVSGSGMVVSQLAVDNVHFSGRLPKSQIGRIERPEVMTYLPDMLLKGSLTAAFRSIAISPDGRLMALHDRSQVVIHEVASGRLIARQELKEAIAMSFAADGESLLVAHTNGLEVWTLARENTRLVLRKAEDIPAPKDRVFVSGRMLQDGERFLMSTPNMNPYHELWRLYRDKLKWERQPAPGSPTAGIADVTPDGIFNIGGQNQFNVVNNIQKKQFYYLELDDLKNALGAFSPDGKKLVMVDVLHRWKLHDEKAWKQPVTDRPLDQMVSASGSVGGSMIAVWARSGRWFVVSPDGKKVTLVDVESQSAHLTLESPIDLLIDIMHLAEDERTLVIQRQGGSVEVWHLEKLLRELERLGVPCTLPAAPATKPSSAVLEGKFDSIPLPAWPMDWKKM
jgi:tRNA A-37 threonylcarbamoyl transferase component Bud32